MSKLAIKDGYIQLPADVLEKLGDIDEIYYAIIDDDSILLSIISPTVRANKAIMDQIAEINSDVSNEDYIAPVPGSFLDKK